MQFPHEKLSVYQKALDFFGGIQRHISSWSKQHAFVDHLKRAGTPGQAGGRAGEGTSRKSWADDSQEGLHRAMICHVKGWSPNQNGMGSLSCFPPIVNCLANSVETNSIVNLAENCFERFYVTLCDRIYHMLWGLE